jgi:phage terminase small subunit
MTRKRPPRAPRQRTPPAPPAAPAWADAIAAFTAFTRARDTQQPAAMIASLARLDAVLARADTAAAPGTLSAAHQRFVDQYLIDLNATAAYRRAGFVAKDADVAGPRLLGSPGVAAAIAAGKARQLAAADLSAARVLEELRRVAFASARDYFDADGSLKHPHQLTAEQAASVAGLEVVIKNVAAGDGHTDTIHKLKFWPKVHALELLAKHFELLVERVKVDTTDAEARVALLIAARKRVKSG